MNKTVNITIPDYLSVENYKKMLNIEHLTDINKMIYSISVLGGIDEEEIKTWAPSDIGKIAGDLSETMAPENMFYPIFEHEGQLYGYSNIHQMSLGEYTDLERLCKDTTANLEEIMALLYRPIKKHIIKDIGFRALHNVRIFTKQLDNPFKWYTLEKYSSDDRLERAEIFKTLPVSMALGAMGFFLALVNQYLANTGIYSQTPVMKEMKKILIEANDRLFQSFGDGLRQYILSPRQVFSTSQETVVL